MQALHKQGKERLTATVSGYILSLSRKCISSVRLAARRPRAIATCDGILYGSRAWIFLPVGNTPEPSRRRSPPGAGGTYCPARAATTPSSSLLFRLSRSRIAHASRIAPVARFRVQGSGCWVQRLRRMVQVRVQGVGFNV